DVEAMLSCATRRPLSRRDRRVRRALFEEEFRRARETHHFDDVAQQRRELPAFCVRQRGDSSNEAVLRRTRGTPQCLAPLRGKSERDLATIVRGSNARDEPFLD